MKYFEFKTIEQIKSNLKVNTADADLTQEQYDELPKLTLRKNWMRVNER